MYNDCLCVLLHIAAKEKIKKSKEYVTRLAQILFLGKISSKLLFILMLIIKPNRKKL